MADKVKLAFIGSGGVVRSHLQHSLRDFEGVEFVAWCDLNEEAAAARREQVGDKGKVYTDARKMLDETKPDAVYIMLPPFTTIIFRRGQLRNLGRRLNYAFGYTVLPTAQSQT